MCDLYCAAPTDYFHMGKLSIFKLRYEEGKRIVNPKEVKKWHAHTKNEANREQIADLTPNLNVNV